MSGSGVGIRKELFSGESILWEGRPDPFKFFMRRGFWVTLTSVPFLAFSVFWTLLALSGGLFFILWGLMFIGVGAGAFLYGVSRLPAARRTEYAVTDHRVLIREGSRVVSVEPEKLSAIDRRNQRSYATFIIERGSPYGVSFQSVGDEVAVIGVRRPDEFEAALRRLRELYRANR
jgi:hypothetical protein